MIPKIIHYTWFSGEEMPREVQTCIASWREFLPDYELRLWDMESIQNIDSIFLKEALSVRKWAYAADFVRLYALFHEGGIYLDTDVLVRKSFDEFLKYQCFIGKEKYIRFENFAGVQYLTSHCMGAEKGNKFIKDCLDYYIDRHFVISKNENLPTLLRFNYVLIPYIQAVIALDYGYDWDPRHDEIQNCNDGLVIFPCDFFNGNSIYCRHLALGSWREHFVKENPRYRIFLKIRSFFSGKLRKFLLRYSRVLMKIEINR